MRSKPVFLSVLGSVLWMAQFVDQAHAQRTDQALLPHPNWDCSMPEGIPSPESGSLIFEIAVPLDRAAEVGQTPFGNRRIAVGLQGAVDGPNLSATVMEGALDFELTLANGTIEIEQILVLRAADGRYILVRNAGTGPDASNVRLVVDFEAPADSEHAWLNSGQYVARREADFAEKSLVVRVYDVTGFAVNAADAIPIVKPAGIPAQTWGYRVKAPEESEGEPLITENVTLGPSQTVGVSKRGNRNIIPITGGELSGRLTGSVLMGGADYQDLDPPATIDARYLWQADDGEIIIVRNGGPFGSLAPTFEARVDGPYAYLNTGLYLSSNPAMGQGGVALTFFESKK